MKRRLTSLQRTISKWQTCLLAVALAMLGFSGQAQITNITWVAGAEHPYNWGIYGTKGVADAANSPGGRVGAAEWQSGGNYWIFGGSGPYDGDCCGFGGSFNDLWKWDGTAWTWISGSNTAEQLGVYGTQGVANAANMPGARSNAMSWTDASGNMWLFGGQGYDESGSVGYLNDLWKFDGTNWTWISGSKTVNSSGVYGSKGIANAANTPGGRHSSVSFTNNVGDFWLFGGEGKDVNGASGLLNDLWKFDGTNWTWVSGSNLKDVAGNYGTLNNWNANNMPGGRAGAAGWYNSTDNYFFLFGGGGYDTNSSWGYLNDIWAYSLNDDQWLWMMGSNVRNASGVYGTKGTGDATTIPGARQYASAVTDAATGQMFLYGGYGKDVNGTTGNLNDLWVFNPQGTMTWAYGDNTSNSPNRLGAKNKSAVQNNIGGRYNASVWVNNYRFWIFGGNVTGGGNMNDMWYVNRYGTIPQNQVFKMKIPGTNLCLTETSGTDRRCQLVADNNSSTQLWYLQQGDAEGTMFVKNLSSNAFLVFSATGDVVAQNKNGGNILAYPMVMADDITGLTPVQYEARVQFIGSNTHTLNFGNRYVSGSSYVYPKMTAEGAFAGADIYQYYDLTGGYSSWEVEFPSNQFIIWDGITWSNNSGPSTSSDMVMIDGDFSLNVNTITTGDLKITRDGSVTVPNYRHLSVYGNLDVMGDLTIESGGALALKGASPKVSGVATVQRKTTGNAGYSIVGSPITSASFTDLSADHLYEYNTSNQSWSVPAGTMAPGKGYFAAFNEAAPEITFTGTLNSGIISSQISTAGDAFNLVANPFSAALTISSFLADANMQNLTTGTIYLWDDGGSNAGNSRGGDYVTVNQVGVAVNALADGISGTKGSAPAARGYIGSMQGFFVEATGNGSLTFDPAYLPFGNAATGNTNGDIGYYRTTEQQLIKLSLSGNGHYNEILIGLEENGTMGKDYSLDAKKRTSNLDFNFYSLINEEKYIIQGLPAAAENPMEITLGTDLTTTAQYTLKVEEFIGLENWNVQLTDLSNGDSWIIKAGSQLNFTLAAGNDSNRWKLSLVPAQILSAPQELTKIQLFDRDEMLTVRYADVSEAQINIYTLDGRLIFQKEVRFEQKEAVIAPNLNRNQVYLLNINGETIKFIRK